jgi:uncharacterized protein (TIGR04222 family)
MSWLLDNSLADMQGPNFLIFYGIFACLVLTAAYFFIAMQDNTGATPPPQTPSAVDPYELAYLRGGANEVIRTAIYALRRRGLMGLPVKDRITPTGAEAQELTDQELTEIERLVFSAISTGPKISALFADKYLRGALESACAAYQQRLSAQQLLAPPEARRAARLTLAVAGALLIALAGYKTSAAVMHGHSNLGFLFLETAAACVILFWVFQRATAGNSSKRGKAYLAQVQTAYSGHLGALSSAEAGGGGSAAIDGAALLMVGLFGFAILKDTPDAALAQAFAQSSGSGGDGGGCGGGGGGGGCGGCGGGGGD